MNLFEQKKLIKTWRRQSDVPPLPVEWLVSLFNYRFYAAGQTIDLPTIDPVAVCWADGSSVGTVLFDTLVDAIGCEVLPDAIVDSYEQSDGRER